MDRVPLRRLSATTAAFALALLVAGCGSESSASDGPAAGATAGGTAANADADAASRTAPRSDAPPEILVYKSPTCGCCEGWVEHLRAEGFEVNVEDRTDMLQIKNMLGIPGDLRSCHTALVGNYLVEGHVPAADVRTLLAERPQVAGLAVPGMPVGSPGMEVPGRAPDRYDVLSFDADGRTTVFASH